VKQRSGRKYLRARKRDKFEVIPVEGENQVDESGEGRGVSWKDVRGGEQACCVGDPDKRKQEFVISKQ